MKLIIAGYRSIDSVVAYDLIESEFWERELDITEVVSGGALGVDNVGKDWADERGLPVKIFKPDYDRFGSKVAPIMRNIEMGKYADELLAIWDGKSRGTAHMVAWMRRNGKPVYLRTIK